MANSTYEIREVRAVISDERTDLYVLCGPDSDGGGLVGGWYHKTFVPSDGPALDLLTRAIVNQDYLMWDRGAPKP